MSDRNFVGNIESQSQPLSARPHRASEKGLEEPIQVSCGNGRTPITDRQLKMVRNNPGAYLHGTVLGTVRQGITQKIGEELGDAASIAIDRLSEGKFRFNSAGRTGG